MAFWSKWSRRRSTLMLLLLGLLPLVTFYLLAGRFRITSFSSNSPLTLYWPKLTLPFESKEFVRHNFYSKNSRLEQSNSNRSRIRKYFSKTRISDKELEKAPKDVKEHLQDEENELVFSRVASLTEKPPGCKGDMCLNFLSDSELRDYRACLNNSTRRWKNHAKQSSSNEGSKEGYLSGTQSGTHCRFQNGEGRGTVGLVSFPGSGNTWVRQLLQMATGICTGSQYCDSSLLLRGMAGEGVQSAAVLVIKSHTPKKTWTSQLHQLERGGMRNTVKFDSAIFLIRNPYHALVSEWNRLLSTKYNLGTDMTSQHTHADFGKQYFLDNPRWKKFVKNFISRWRRSFEWVLNTPPGHRLMVVTYEELKRNRATTVHRMLDFLRYDISNKELKKRLSGEGSNVFKRPPSKPFEHFTREQRALINLVLHTMLEFLELKLKKTFGIEDYIRA